MKEKKVLKRHTADRRKVWEGKETTVKEEELRDNVCTFHTETSGLHKRESNAYVKGKESM